MRTSRYLLTAALLAGTSVPVAAQDSRTPEQVAAAALEAAPVWDGHNDVPIQLRARFDNQLADFDFEDTTGTGAEHSEGRTMHTDLIRLARGQGRCAILVGLCIGCPAANPKPCRQWSNRST